MNIDDIIVRIKLISSLDDKEISRWMPICYDCMQYIENRIRDKTLMDLYSDRLSFAAAVFFYYNYCLYGTDSNMQSFKAGDVQLSLKSSVEFAKNLWAEEKERLGDILDFSDEKESDAFFFRGVAV